MTCQFHNMHGFIEVFLYLNFYIMIIKFKSESSNNLLEIEKVNESVYFNLEDEDCLVHSVEISKKNLFSLIGQLLRIQSELKNQ